MNCIAIFGIGNVLIGDDAAGPSIIRYLESHYRFPDHVVLADVGTPSLDLAGRMTGFDAVIFVDAVSAKGKAGEIRQYDRAQIIKNPPTLRMSPHDPSLKESILLLDLLPDAPRYITLIGIIPETLAQFGLSAAVRAAIPIVASRVLSELAALGVEVAGVGNAAAPPEFWERDAVA